MSPAKNTYCLSCQTIFPEGAKFCHVCGQNKRASILSFKELWTNFWNTVFNVDNSFFNTLRLLPRPDKITKLYVAGERKKYINPIRLFLILLVFLVAASLASSSIFGKSNPVGNQYMSYQKAQLLEDYDNTVASENLSEEEFVMSEALKNKVFGDQKCPDFDTIYQAIGIMDFDDVKPILNKDFIELDEEEIYEKYNAKSFWQKLKYRQFLRLNKDPSSGIKFLLSNAGWGLIPSILLLSLFLKLLYRNFKIQYLEHLILVVNVHSFIFLVLIIYFLLLRFANKGISEFSSMLAILIAISYPLFIIYKYYGENIFRSSIKYILSGIFYFFISVIFIAISMVISGFIF